jgi:hypothetical protein
LAVRLFLSKANRLADTHWRFAHAGAKSTGLSGPVLASQVSAALTT